MKQCFLNLLLAAFFMSCAPKTEPSAVAPDPITPPEVITASKMCFVEALNRDTMRVSFTLEGDVVTGTMQWRPWEKDGAIGYLKGKKVGDIITADFDYMIEGSRQLEEKVFQLLADKLIEKNGPMQEINGKMVIIDIAKATNASTMTKIDCANLNIAEVSF